MVDVIDQDVLFFDQSGLYGRAADLYDRHRDLRLDVDNMSYEVSYPAHAYI